MRYPESAPQESWNFKGQMKQFQGKPKEKLYEIKAKALKDIQSGKLIYYMKIKILISFFIY